MLIGKRRSQGYQTRLGTYQKVYRISDELRNIASNEGQPNILLDEQENEDGATRRQRRSLCDGQEEDLLPVQRIVGIKDKTVLNQTGPGNL